MRTHRPENAATAPLPFVYIIKIQESTGILNLPFLRVVIHSNLGIHMQYWDMINLDRFLFVTW